QCPAEELGRHRDLQGLAHTDDEVADFDALHLVVGHELDGPAPKAHHLRPHHSAAFRHENLAELAYLRGRTGALDQQALHTLHHPGKLDGIKVFKDHRVLVEYPHVCRPPTRPSNVWA